MASDYLKKLRDVPVRSETAAETLVVVPPDPATEDRAQSKTIGDAGPRFSHCPTCHHPLVAPPPAIQVANFAKWQHDKISYYWWNDAQLRRLAERLAPGDVLMLPAFAHSVNVRRPDGSVYTHGRVK